MEDPEKLLIAHRGESFDAPENTLASINLAWERKVRAVEIDIHLTKDNQVVVIHDYNTKRISGVKKVIRESTLSELKNLDFGSFKNAKWENERIPTLPDVLKTVPDDGKLIIEIKSSDRILPKLKVELSNSGLKNSQIEIITYNSNTLAKAKQIMPEYKMLWLLDLDYFWPAWILRVNKKKIIQKVKNRNLDGVDVWAGKILNKDFISTLKNAGLLVYCFTIDDPQKARQLKEYGIDGITTNRAAWMKEQLEK
ncbi:MAG: glycerophosphodiester phosphodiesterase [Bacteroidales bacterium]|nr:glycerophosphodiester phosphodiesterase [Bacteroidales bacterium]MCF8456283.1 glycerophosphodiester phosphodiesterase [Bacteroidales bacterium]